MDTAEDGKESGLAAAEQSSCGRAEDGGELPEEKHAVCFSDRGRSLAVSGLPGGAVCFAGNVGSGMPSGRLYSSMNIASRSF